jgi:tetratricopeptide (TPR) repeat protein
MERRRKMDTARLARIRRTLKFLICFVLICSGCLTAGQTSPDSEQVQKAEQLADKERWQEVVSLAKSVPARSAELNYLYGTALAHLERWQEAHQAFQAGEKSLPSDERFPVELGGVDFKQKHYREATVHLRRALRLAPKDPYANEFLATVYFLEGNFQASMKYWNRMDKPKIISVRLDPKPRANAALLDHAFVVAPASTLQLPDLYTSETRIRGLDIFSQFNFDLQARNDGDFDLVFHNHERNGLGANKWEALLNIFHDLPEQTVNFNFGNYRDQAINFNSLYRWDAQKRRVTAELSSPLRLDPKRRIAVGIDLRGENWDIRQSSARTAPLLGSFNMRREAANLQLSTFQSGRWNWKAGVEFSHRDFRDVFLGSVLTPELLGRGYQLKQTTEANAALWRFPERRLTLTSGVSSEAGRVWSTPAQAFEKLQGSLRLHWFPQAVGDDYEFQQQFRAGKTWGNIPFDELFTLGGIGDNNLIMRGHITTHDGRKGSGPLGRNYFLYNWEIDKNVYHDSLFAVKLGPFLDTGKITDPLPGLGSHKWLYDTGAQVKVKALGVSFAVIYGKDLRSGNNAVFVTLLN